MPISFRHDAAAVMPSSNQAQRKYGQSLVLQQQQQKYNEKQAGYDRLFQLGRDQQQFQNDFVKDVRQQTFLERQARDQNKFQLDRDKALAEQQQQQQEVARQNAFMDEARKQSAGMIMEDIKNGMYDPVTARKLQQSLVDEAEALGNRELDATMRAEALAKIRAKRLLDSANRLEKPPAPTDQEVYEKSIVTDPVTGQRMLPDGKGRYQPIPEKPQRPSSATEAFAADPKLRDKYVQEAIAMETKKDGFGKDIPLDREGRKKAVALAQQLWEDDNLPNEAPPRDEGPAPTLAARGPSQSILEAPTAASPDPGYPPAPGQMIAQSPDAGSPPAPGGTTMMAQSPDPGMPPAPTGAPMVAQRPDPGMPPAPTQAPTMAARPDAGMPPAPATPQQVKVGGKPLVITPGTLTPQETQAREQLMQMPREERIAMLMPYDPELKGKTIEQVLEDPKHKAAYEEMAKEGLTTGNYREDMLAQMDSQLYHNVLNRAGTPQPAYEGMRADQITDPKGKAEVAKMPRPKTEDEIKAIRGPFFVDPGGIIRSTKKQA